VIKKPQHFAEYSEPHICENHEKALDKKKKLIIHFHARFLPGEGRGDRSFRMALNTARSKAISDTSAASTVHQQILEI